MALNYSTAKHTNTHVCGMLLSFQCAVLEHNSRIIRPAVNTFQKKRVLLENCPVVFEMGRTPMTICIPFKTATFKGHSEATYVALNYFLFEYRSLHEYK